MKSQSLIEPAVIDEERISMAHDVLILLEQHLLPEECDETSSAYRLGWYRRIETRTCTHNDIALFRRFVDDMCERALYRASQTEALFRSESVSRVDTVGSKFNVLRARHFCEGLGGD